MTSDEFSSWRKRYGLTQEKAAEQFRVTRNTIQNWESGSSALPGGADDLCRIWGRRYRQLDPVYGPLTLVYSDGPMFINAFGPRSRPAMMYQEPCISNAAALARIQVLYEAEGLFNAFVLEKVEPDDVGDALWNVREITDVLLGRDTGAPTVNNMLRVVAARICETTFFAVNGSTLLTQEQKLERKAKLEVEAQKLVQIASHPTISETLSNEISHIFAEIRKLGVRPPDAYVSGIAQASVAKKQ